MQQVVSNVNSGSNLKQITVIDPDQHISWKRYTKGSVYARFTVHNKAKWIDMSLEECYRSDKDKLISKKTMMSVNEEGARALYEMLKGIFDESV